MLGVLFTIPLRRALVTTSDLPYPGRRRRGRSAEGRIGHARRDEGRCRRGARGPDGRRARLGRVGRARDLRGDAHRRGRGQRLLRLAWARDAVATSGYDIAFSLALFGAGHLVGLSVGMAMLAGLLIAWAGARADPHLPAAGARRASTSPTHTTADLAARRCASSAPARSRSRRSGRWPSSPSRSSAGWSARSRRRAPAPPATSATATCRRPGSSALTVALPRRSPALARLCRSSAARRSPDTRRRSRSSRCRSCCVGRLPDRRRLRLHGRPHRRVEQPDLRRRHPRRSSRCATVLVLAVPPTPETRPALVAFALFVTAIVFACATISNDNLQDLKTGQLVGASPRRQQIALIVGVIAGAAGDSAGAEPAGASRTASPARRTSASIAENPLPAPQATLISALAQGVIGGNLDWKMIGIGLLVGVGVIVLDETLGALKQAAHSAARRRHRHLPADVGDVRRRRRRRRRPLVQRSASKQRTDPAAPSGSACSSRRA